MKIKITPERVKQLIALIEECAASESTSPRDALEQFLNDLPSDQKYEVLALAGTTHGDYEDFESAIEEAKYKIKETELTDYLIKIRHLNCHLTDAVKFGWLHFEQPFGPDEDDDEETEK